MAKEQQYLLGGIRAAAAVTNSLNLVDGSSTAAAAVGVNDGRFQGGDFAAADLLSGGVRAISCLLLTI